jgi:hypothetical protein
MAGSHDKSRRADKARAVQDVLAVAESLSLRANKRRITQRGKKEGKDEWPERESKRWDGSAHNAYEAFCRPARSMLGIKGGGSRRGGRPEG